MIVAVVASYGRFPLLRRLLDSLRASEPEPPRLIVVDNLGGGEAERVVRSAGFVDATVLSPGENLGTGGGLALGLRHALEDPRTRYCVQLDDDATVSPRALHDLAAALDASPCGAALPLLLRADGTMGWFPGVIDRHKWRVVLRARTRLLPEEYLAECGTEPTRFTWAAWPVLMLKRSAIERVGLPRQDIWFQAVDLEYTLRLAYHVGNLWVPAVRCWHLPPQDPEARARFYWRDCVGLHNCSYIFARLPHGRLALKHLPGNYRRFFRDWGVRPQTVADAFRCFWWGTVRARPVGAPGYTRFREKWLAAGRGEHVGG